MPRGHRLISRAGAEDDLAHSMPDVPPVGSVISSTYSMSGRAWVPANIALRSSVGTWRWEASDT